MRLVDPTMVSDASWESSLSAGNEVRFVPLLDFGRSKRLVLRRDGSFGWALLRESLLSLYPLDGEGSIGVLPILESPLEDVEARARNRAGDFLRTPADAVTFIPVKQICLVALAAGSEYWIGLALSWLEYAEPIGVDVAKLRELSRSRHLSQNTRHRLLRLAARLDSDDQ